MPNGRNPFTKVIDRYKFTACFDIWLDLDPVGRAYKSDLKLGSAREGLLGYKLKIDIIVMDRLATDGVAMMEDLRRIEKSYGPGEGYSWLA